MLWSLCGEGGLNMLYVASILPKVSSTPLDCAIQTATERHVVVQKAAAKDWGRVVEGDAE